jgi:hypothetical protein
LSNNFYGENMKKRLLIALFITAIGSSLPALAQDTAEDSSCQIECPVGQVKISFADGNKVACVCSEESTAMVDTPETVASCEDSNDDGNCD